MLRKILLVGLGLSAHASALALGLGEIRLESALNEPLVAEIPISITSRDELRGFEARIARNETFARYGIDRPIFLNSITFRVTNNAAGQPVISVRSARPIAEPFVTFLLEATWDSGRLLREYTVLLDPPVFSELTVAAPVNVAQSVTAQPSGTSGQIAPAPVVPAPAPAPAPVYRQPAITGQTYGPVQRNQNLWNISRSVQLDGVSINQMMVAIYRANPEAFMGNINLLKEGATLQIPDAGSVRNLLQSDANSVVVSHNAEWRGGRVASGSQTASTPGTSAPAKPRLKLVAPESGEAGAGSSDDSGALDATRELLADEQAENAELTSELDTVRAELEETKRLLNLRNSDLAELQQSLGQDSSAELAVEELPSDSVVEATVDGGDTVTDGEGEPVVAQTDTDTSAETTAGSETRDPTSLLEPQQPVEQTKVDPVASVDTGTSGGGESFFAKLLGFLTNWVFLGALALFGVVATLFVMFRNRGEETTEPWDALEADDSAQDNLDLDASLDEIAQRTMAKDTTDVAAREVEYFEDTGTFKPIDFDASSTGQVPAIGSADQQAPFEDTLAGETGVKLDQADTLSEADFHMAYGLYDQAAELVGKAAEKEPDRVDLKMKLLEIFFVWGNKDEFRSGAEASKDMLMKHPGEWDKIMIMGKQICPGDDLFEGDASADVMGGEGVDLQLETASSDEGGLDFQSEDFSGDDVFADLSGGDQVEDIVDLDLGDALFAGDDAPTAAGADAEALDFSFDDEEAHDDDAPTASTEEVKEKIEQVLSADTGDATEEMDLDQLGIDLDFGDITSVSEGTSGEFAVHDVRAKNEVGDDDDDFDELFDGLGEEDDAPSAVIDADILADDAPHDKLLDTSELKVEMEELLKADKSGLMDQDETSRGTKSLMPDDDMLSDLVDDSDDETGSFSAEIRSLANDEIEIGEELAATSGAVDFGFGDDDDTVLQEALVSLDGPQESEPAEFEDVFAGSDEETVLASTLVADSNDMDLSDPFGDSSQDTSAMPVLTDTDVGVDAAADDSTSQNEAVTFQGVFDEPAETEQLDQLDDFSDDVFPSPDGRTQEVQAVDLDVGGSVDDSGDNTTMRVATSNLALPENADLAINEVGTKLDLARAYLDMGDPDGARGILEEVMQEGNDNQQADARALLDGIS